MDKILFIVPLHVTFNHFINPSYNTRTVIRKSDKYGSVITDMPLGVLSLSAYMKKHTAAETRLVDFNIVLNKLESFEFRSFAEFFHDFLSAPGWANYAPSIIGITASDRINAVAASELGAVVKSKEAPLAINEVIHPSRRIRGHFISLLYECTLISSLDKNLEHEKGIPKPGEWAWHNKCPNDIIPVHEMYRKFM